MKKIRFTGKLSLNKETVSKLNQEQMNQVVGGSLRCITAASCNTCGCPPPQTMDGCFSQMVTVCCQTAGCSSPGYEC